MQRWHLRIEYDGTGLVGWQKQKEGTSVQALLEQAIHRFCQEEVQLFAAGRTDAGVHALAMSVHVDVKRPTTEQEIFGALNAWLLDMPVRVVEVIKVTEQFHARFSAIKRHYCYRILNRPASSVLHANRVWHIMRPLDLEAMRKASQYLLGHHDFTSFRASHCQAKSPMKTLDAVTLEQQGEQIIFGFSARSFLHHQVRNMVGTLAEIGHHKHLPDAIQTMLEAKSRIAAGATAPAHGLYFIKADY